jgi:uncharacterized membrane protein
MSVPLFAPVDDQAFAVGVVIGLIIVTVLCGALPVAIGTNKGQPALGWIGGAISGVMGFLFGIIGGLPTALVFVAIICAVGSNQPTRRRRPRYDDYEDDDDDDDRPRNRRRRRDYDDDEDDDDHDRRPRSRDYR